jgi:stage II sporulation protein R
MKKIVFFIGIVVLVMCIIQNKKEILIPDQAIRIRIIANSNNVDDQLEKNEIKSEISSLLYKKLEGVNSYNDAKQVINENINNIKEIVNKYSQNYEIEYGKNYFPEKEYKGVNYKEGKYESLVIKLGEAKGNNFWCILFPPLCMIDESKMDDVSYQFYINRILNKIK